MEIYRETLLDLTNWKNSKNRLPLIIQGARQVGKTFLLKKFAKSFPNSFYLNLEKQSSAREIFLNDLDGEKLLKKLELYFQNKINLKEDLLIIDEIQTEPSAITALKYFAEDLPDLAVCAAGSLLGVTLNSKSHPVGKVDYLNMYPVTFFELLKSLNLENEINDFKTDLYLEKFRQERLWEIFKDYLVIGGLPASVSNYLDNYKNTIEALKGSRIILNRLVNDYLADIVKHSGKEKALHLQRIFNNVPIQLAKIEDGSTKKYVFKSTEVPTLRGYEDFVGPLAWLKKAKIIIQTNIIENIQIPLITNLKENFFKLYSFDVGILNAMNNLEIQHLKNFNFGTYKGYIAENFVAQELLAKNTLFYCWQKNTSEVEFIYEKEGEVNCIEVKSGDNTRSKSLDSFISQYGIKKAYLLRGEIFNKSLKVVKDVDVKIYPLYFAGLLGKE